MADSVKKGVIVEFDFAAMDGAKLLFTITKNFLSALDKIPFDERIEAQHLAGGNYQGALAEYFSVVKTKKTAAKAAKDLAAAFEAALNEAVPKAVGTVQPAFAGILGENVVLYHESSATYGSVKWDAWRRACAMNKLRNFSTIAITGSGLGVKSALVAGMGSVAVINPHVAYQDFGGADEVVRELNAAAAKTVLEVLRV